MAGSGSSGGSYSSGSAGYSGSAAGKGSYGSSLTSKGGYGKNILSGLLTKYSISDLANYLTGSGKLYSDSKIRDSYKILGIREKYRLMDFQNPPVSSLLKKQNSYDLEAVRPKRMIDLEEYMDKEFKKYKKKCPNCGINVSGISYSMN